MDAEKYKKGTAAVWAVKDDEFYRGAVTPPIVKSVTFAYHDRGEWKLKSRRAVR